MKKKGLTGFKVTDAEAGKVEAVFSTLNAIDSDKDVTKAGAFTDGAKVRISAYNHASWGPGMLPVGKGTIRESGDEAIMEGEFFLNTGAGKETFEVVKQMGDLQEWSYGYDVEQSSDGQLDGEDVTYLEKLTVHEVSPVILGAGVNTRTLTAKGKQLASDLQLRLDEAGTERFGADRTYVYVSDFDLDSGWVVYSISGPDSYTFQRGSYSRNADGDVTLGDDFAEVERTTDYRPKGDDEPAGRKLADHLDAVIADVEEVGGRLADAAAQRAEKGQKLADSTLERGAKLESATKRLGEALATEPQSDDNLDLDLDLTRAQARVLSG